MTTNRRKYVDRKYVVLRDIRNANGLYRISAFYSFNGIEAGDLGGWVEGEHNLSHVGDCWIADDAQVYENARVSGDAQVSGHAQVLGSATISGRASLSDNATVFGSASVRENVKMRDASEVSGKAIVSGNVDLRDNAWVRGNAKLAGDYTLFGKALVDQDTPIFPELWGNVTVKEETVNVNNV